MAPAGRLQRRILALSLDVLRDASERCGERRVDTVAVRLALCCLLRHCPERWPLDMFLASAGQDNDIGRAQGVTAAYNGVVRQLRLAGRHPDPDGGA